MPRKSGGTGSRQNENRSLCTGLKIAPGAVSALLLSQLVNDLLSGRLTYLLIDVQSASKIRVQIVPGIPTCPIQEDIMDGLKQRTSASIVMLAGQQPAETVGYSTTSGNSSSVAPVTDSCADFAAFDSRAIYLGSGFLFARNVSGQTQTCPPMKVTQGQTTTMMTTTTTINHL